MTKEEKRKYDKNYRKNNKELLKAKALAYYNSHKEERKLYDKKYYKDNIEKEKIAAKKYGEKNREKIRLYSKEWYEKNKDNVKKRYENNAEKRKEYCAEYYKTYYPKNKKRMHKYQRDRRKTDNVFRLKCNMRSRMGVIFKNISGGKPAKTEILLGAKFVKVKEHIENQFRGGMGWHNYGDWHIDHVIPLASAKNIEEIISLMHYTNLQPLWKQENLLKGAKILEKKPLQLRLVI